MTARELIDMLQSLDNLDVRVLIDVEYGCKKISSVEHIEEQDAILLG